MALRGQIEDLILLTKRNEGTDMRGAIRDILTDIVHICNDNGFDIVAIVESATEVAREENI